MNRLAPRTLVLGGARSGKSRYAETLAQDSGLAVTYIATASAGDAEMQARIQQHRDDRPAHWTTLEEPQALGAALRAQASVDRCVIVDCLTLWLSHLLCGDDAVYRRERADLLSTLPTLPGPVVLVSNETGLGIVPMGELTRRYIDEAGRLHQQLAAQCEAVVFCVAGLPMILKPSAVQAGVDAGARAQ